MLLLLGGSFYFPLSMSLYLRCISCKKYLILFFIYSAGVLNRTFILFIFNIDNDVYGSIQIYQLIICFSICLTFYIFFQIFLLAYFPLLLTYKLYFLPLLYTPLEITEMKLYHITVYCSKVMLVFGPF